jgi:glyoxylase-like metal-dependent hydrolase (beta-lactamase superfamily II)
MSQYKITAIKTGNITVPKAGITYMSGFDKTITVPVWVAAIEGNGIKAVLDTGVRFQNKWEKYSPHWANDGETLEEGLSELGWKIDDIDIVFNSHLHYDHAENNTLFKKSRFVVSRAEWEYAKKPIPSQTWLYDFEWTDEHITEANYEMIASDNYEFLPGLTLIQTPGHSRGHQSLLVTTSEGVVCIAGDAACLPENFSRPTPPAGATSIEQGFDSLEKIRSSAQFVFMNHDPNIEKFQTGGFLSVPAAYSDLPTHLVETIAGRAPGFSH